MDLLGWLLQVDGTGFHLINQGMQNPLFDFIMPLITDLGTGGLIWLLAMFLLAVFGKGPGRKMAYLAAVAFIVSWLISDEVLKGLFARPRPFLHFSDARLLVEAPLQYSFPSGHSTTAFAPAVVFFRKNRIIGTIALVVAVLIAFSRVYVGVHYPLDVLGGFVLGSTVGYLAVRSEASLDKLAVWSKGIFGKANRRSGEKKKVS